MRDKSAIVLSILGLLFTCSCEEPTHNKPCGPIIIEGERDYKEEEYDNCFFYTTYIHDGWGGRTKTKYLRNRSICEARHGLAECFVRPKSINDEQLFTVGAAKIFSKKHYLQYQFKFTGIRFDLFMDEELKNRYEADLEAWNDSNNFIDDTKTSVNLDDFKIKQTFDLDALLPPEYDSTISLFVTYYQKDEGDDKEKYTYNSVASYHIKRDSNGYEIDNFNYRRFFARPTY